MNKALKSVILVILMTITCVLMVGPSLISMKVFAANRIASWNAVTTYTDGSTIEAGNTVSYSIWYEDNVTKTTTQIANRITLTSTTFDDVTMIKGRAYNFWGQAFLVSGTSSDNSVKTAWALPLGKVAPMGTITIQ